jgi:hypothetical protein
MGYDPFEIVKDSTIWRHETDQKAIMRKDPYLRLGIVKRIYRDSVTTDIRYLVEMRDMNDAIEVNCRLLRRLGGAFNYEDTILHGYKISDQPDATTDFKAKAGDTVLVAFLNGEAREAIILGGVSHPARASTLAIDKGPQYLSEFNGVENSINDNGEFTVTFKGIPTNIAVLDKAPSAKLPAPTYDTAVGTTFMKFDKTGSWEISDNAKSDLQRIRIDKPNGQILVNAGQVSLKITKSSQDVALKTKTLEITADTSITEKTTDWATTASATAKIKSPKVAFGTDGIELLDQLAQLVDAIGMLTAISPVGPCSPLTAAPQWSGVDAIKAKIKEITGSL